MVKERRRVRLLASGVFLTNNLNAVADGVRTVSMAKNKTKPTDASGGLHRLKGQ